MVKDNRVQGIDIMLKKMSGENGLFSTLLIQTKNVAGQKSHSVKLEDLQTLRRNASMVGRVGVYMINFGENQEFMMMRKQDWDYYFAGEPDDETEGQQSDDGSERNSASSSSEES